MRKLCFSSSTSATTPWSARADSRSWPNGFSITTRDHGPLSGGATSPLSRSPFRIGPNDAGGTAR